MDKSTCKYFNGAFHNKKCDAGVCYADVTPDWQNRAGVMLRLPCHTEPFPNSTPTQLAEFNRRGSCPKFTAPTDAELAVHKAETNKRVARMRLTFPIIDRVKREHVGEEWQGIEKCPACGGNLHLSHAAYNGHVWGRCETADCLSWME